MKYGLSFSQWLRRNKTVEDLGLRNMTVAPRMDVEDDCAHPGGVGCMQSSSGSVAWLEKRSTVSARFD